LGAKAVRSSSVLDRNEKAVFDLGTYVFGGREYRLLYSWPMLYAQCGPEESETQSAPAEDAALASAAAETSDRPPLAEAYARAVAQGYILQRRTAK
jgi:hypothetical protein